ncbi:MAG: iron-sulfur cluster assembly accessory protein [Deltaproteobacteria bacterium]|nr:iron-sulfur cluster assembly accessory protein [Deltaproteobacteria bacterium]
MAIAVSDRAAARIRELIAQQHVESPDAGLRIGVKGGGCSGLTYTMRLDTTKRLGDKVFEANGGTKVYVDLKSYIYLNGTELDYEEGLMNSGFRFRNPNVKRACGCGESFVV